MAGENQDPPGRLPNGRERRGAEIQQRRHLGTLGPDTNLESAACVDPHVSKARENHGLPVTD